MDGVDPNAGEQGNATERDSHIRHIAALEDQIAWLERASEKPGRRDLEALLETNERVRQSLKFSRPRYADEIQYRLDRRIGEFFDAVATETPPPKPADTKAEPDFLTEAASLISLTSADRTNRKAIPKHSWRWALYLPAMLLILIGVGQRDQYEFQGEPVKLSEFCVATETHEVLDRTVDIIVTDDSGPCDEVAQLATDRTPLQVVLIATGLLTMIVTARIVRARRRAAIRRIPDSRFGGRP